MPREAAPSLVALRSSVVPSGDDAVSPSAEAASLSLVAVSPTTGSFDSAGAVVSTIGADSGDGSATGSLLAAGSLVVAVSLLATGASVLAVLPSSQRSGSVWVPKSSSPSRLPSPSVSAMVGSVW